MHSDYEKCLLTEDFNAEISDNYLKNFFINVSSKFSQKRILKVLQIKFVYICF